MGHRVVVESKPEDPRPFAPENELHWQARCDECDWVGPVRQHSEQEALDDASAHDAGT